MHIRGSLLAVAAGLAAVSAQNDTSTCRDYVIVATRGTFEEQGPSVGFTNMISWTLGNVTNGVEYDTVYPAAQNQTFYLGANDVVRFLEDGLQKCPSQRYVLLGYSQGASVTGAALHNYTSPDSAAYKAIQAVLVIGNPYKIPDKDNDIDQNGGSSNRGFRGALYNESLPNEYGNGIPDIYYSDGKLLDICYENDPICAPESKNATLSAHVLYGASASVQELATRHLVSKLTATNSSGNSSGSSTGGTGSGSPTTSSAGGATSSTAPGAAVGPQIPTSAFVSVLSALVALMI